MKKQLTPNEGSFFFFFIFSETHSVQFLAPERVTITWKSWLQRTVTHKLSNFYFISLVCSCASALNFPKLSHPRGVAQTPMMTGDVSNDNSTRRELVIHYVQMALITCVHYNSFMHYIHNDAET